MREMMGKEVLVIMVLVVSSVVVMEIEVLQ